jgi:transposase
MLAAPEPTPTPPADIRIELRRGAAMVSVSWPVSAASECAAWLREWLR